MKQYFIPTADEIPATRLFVEHIRTTLAAELGRHECVLVFADSGAAKRYEDLPFTLSIDQAYMHKSRGDHSETPTVRALTGDVRDRHCILIDDEILTGNTVLKDAKLLKEAGAASVRDVYAAHAVFADQRLSTQALMSKLSNSEVDQFVVTDTIPVADKVALSPDRFTVLPIAPLLGEAIKRMIVGESLSELHRI